MADEDTTARDPRQRRRTVQGLLIILALVGAAVLVFFLGDIIAAFDRRYEIYALVPDAPGVAGGTPVWVSGRKVGTVTRVSILPSTQDSLERIAVRLDLPRQVESQVRHDSRVRITATGLVGEAVIDIISGTAAAPQLAAGDTIRSEVRLTRQQLTAQAARVRSDLDSVLAAVRQIAPLAATRMDDARRAFAGLDAAMAEAQALRTDMAAGPATALMADAAFRRSLHQARSHADELPAVLTRLQQRAGAAGDIGEAVARLQTQADSLAARLAAAAAMIDEAHGSLGRAQHDTTLVGAVNAARAALDSLMAEVRRNPLRFVF